MAIRKPAPGLPVAKPKPTPKPDSPPKNIIPPSIATKPTVFLKSKVECPSRGLGACRLNYVLVDAQEKVYDPTTLRLPSNLNEIVAAWTALDAKTVYLKAGKWRDLVDNGTQEYIVTDPDRIQALNQITDASGHLKNWNAIVSGSGYKVTVRHTPNDPNPKDEPLLEFRV